MTVSEMTVSEIKLYNVKEKSLFFFDSVGNFRNRNILYKGFSMEDM